MGLKKKKQATVLPEIPISLWLKLFLNHLAYDKQNTEYQKLQEEMTMRMFKRQIWLCLYNILLRDLSCQKIKGFSKTVMKIKDHIFPKELE